MPLSSVLGAQSLVRPGVCTSSTRPASPFEGQVIYETDTDKIMSWNGSAWQFASTPQTAENGVWVSYTPTQTNFTLGNGTSSWKYTVINKVVHVNGNVKWGSTTSLSGDWKISLPITAESVNYTGSINILDTGTRVYTGTIHRQTASDFIMSHSESGNFGIINATNPFTWTTNDELWVSLTYPAA